MRKIELVTGGGEDASVEKQIVGLGVLASEAGLVAFLLRAKRNSDARARRTNAPGLNQAFGAAVLGLNNWMHDLGTNRFTDQEEALLIGTGTDHVVRFLENGTRNQVEFQEPMQLSPGELRVLQGLPSTIIVGNKIEA